MFGFGGKKRLKAEVERLRREQAETGLLLRRAVRQSLERLDREFDAYAEVDRLKAELAQLDAVKATIARTLHEEGEGYRAEIAAYRTDVETHRAVIDRLVAENDRLKDWVAELTDTSRDELRALKLFESIDLQRN